MYSYGIAAQLRRVLSGLVLVASAENVPTANILARHIFELAAHACYVTRNLTNHFAAENWMEAWELLTVPAVANSWVKRYGDKYGPMPTTPDGETLDNPDVLRIGKAIAEYEKYQAEEHSATDAREDYSFLSELSHPNAACFQQHFIYDQNGRDVEIGDAIPSISPLAHVNRALIDNLIMLDRLLGLSEERHVRRGIQAALVAIASTANANTP